MCRFYNSKCADGEECEGCPWTDSLNKIFSTMKSKQQDFIIDSQTGIHYPKSQIKSIKTKLIKDKFKTSKKQKGYE